MCAYMYIYMYIYTNTDSPNASRLMSTFIVVQRL